MKSSCVFLLALFSVAHAAGPVPFANVTRLTMMAVNVDIAPDQSFGLTLNASNCHRGQLRPGARVRAAAEPRH
jgi:hypothetical protein